VRNMGRHCSRDARSCAVIRFLTSLAARRLSKRRQEAQRERILAKARQLREELGLPPSPALGGT
jgi:hypothetical protein